MFKNIFLILENFFNEIKIVENEIREIHVYLCTIQ